MKKHCLFILFAVLALLAAVSPAHAAGFSVGETPPGITAEPIVLRTEGGTETDGVRVTVPFTVRGRLYLLRLVGPDREVLWISQREGGGCLTFDAAFDPLLHAAAGSGSADYKLILTSDAPMTEPAVIPLTYTPETVNVPDGLCRRDKSCPLRQYRDLDPGAWYHDGVHAMLTQGTMNGFDDGTFRPEAETSRAMLVTMLWRRAGEPKERNDPGFSDVPDGAWFAEAVRWAVSAGVVVGYDAKTFGPGDPVTREQLAAILYRASTSSVPNGGRGSLADFADRSEVSAWATDAVRWAVGCGLLNGGGGKLSPDRPASRAEVAAVLARYDGVGK